MIGWVIGMFLYAVIFFVAGAWFGGRRLRIYRKRDPPDTSFLDQW